MTGSPSSDSINFIPHGLAGLLHQDLQKRPQPSESDLVRKRD